MSMRRRLVALLSLVLAGAALAGCGASASLIPPSSATGLEQALQQVSDATSAGDCRAATTGLGRAQSLASALPANLNQRLRARLQAGLTQLVRTVPDQCKAAAAQNARPRPTTTLPTTTTTLPTTTTTTTTQPTTTTTTPTTTTTQPTTTTTQPSGPNGGISPDQPAVGGTP
ncbi:unannotated protein [freshwater metagenome]|uniref:Unannotated protein n=1 Tax=freshwater metagenome TaxID=449393 RepID=A0A6J7CHT4_9ZZZZ